MRLSTSAVLVGTSILFGCHPEQNKTPETVNEQVQNRGEGKDNWYDALPRAAWSRFQKIEQSQDWFEVYEVLPNVLAIYEPGQFEEVISYLIVGSERALLFDTGLGIGDMGQVVSELTDKSPIVLNSHTHYDHVGGNHQFEDIYGTDTEYTKKNAGGRSHEEVKEFVGEGWIWKSLPEDFSPDDYHMEPFTIEATVSDGHQVEIGGRTLEVLLTPGHAPDALCLLDRENRLLFMGDTFYPASLYAHLHGSDFDQYVRTATRLAELQNDVDFVLPAHNVPLLKSDYLGRFRDAFHAITDPKATFVITDGNREYTFGDFSIIVPDPPPWSK